MGLPQRRGRRSVVPLLPLRAEIPDAHSVGVLTGATVVHRYHRAEALRVKDADETVRPHLMDGASLSSFRLLRRFLAIPAIFLG